MATTDPLTWVVAFIGVVFASLTGAGIIGVFRLSTEVATLRQILVQLTDAFKDMREALKEHEESIGALRERTAVVEHQVRGLNGASPYPQHPRHMGAED